jgi:hypothetical protein
MFQPSTHSGYGQAGESEESQEGGPASFTQFIPAIRALVFGESAREEAAVLQAQIENLHRKLAANPPGFLHNIYVDEINKKQARLQEVLTMSEEERQSAAKEAITRTALTLGAVTGVVVIVGMAINQVQKARLTQAQIRQLER